MGQMPIPHFMTCRAKPSEAGRSTARTDIAAEHGLGSGSHYLRGVCGQEALALDHPRTVRGFKERLCVWMVGHELTTRQLSKR